MMLGRNTLRTCTWDFFIAMGCFLAFQMMGYSQDIPPNDGCENAENLCYQSPLSGSLEGASPSAFTACFEPNASVWYTFLTNEKAGDNSLTITIIPEEGCSTEFPLKAIILQEIMEDPCSDPNDRFVVVSACDPQPTDTLKLTSQQILANTRYWVLVDANLDADGIPFTCNFSIAIEGAAVQPEITSEDGITSVLPGESLQLFGSGIDNIGFSWAPRSFLDQTSTLSPLFQVAAEGTYTVELTGRIGNCTGLTTSLKIVVEFGFNPPKGFAPNNKGAINEWRIDDFAQFPNGVIEVYNRWGQRVFVSIGYRTPWDGTRNGKPLPEGTYYWVMKFNRSELNIDDTKTGYVAILR
jgi:gliding motility-associated-like protein